MFSDPWEQGFRPAGQKFLRNFLPGPSESRNVVSSQVEKRMRMLPAPGKEKDRDTVLFS